MTPAPRVTYVTLGARHLPTLRAFYTRLGFSERPGSDDDFATYEAGGVLLALYPVERLGEEAAPGEAHPEPGWNGVTFGINVDTVQAVDEVFRAAVGAGARPVAEPVGRAWGGYSGYIADPEGNRWEITWAPGS